MKRIASWKRLAALSGLAAALWLVPASPARAGDD